MPTVAESREDYRQDHLYQIRLREAASDRNRVENTDTADLAYLISNYWIDHNYPVPSSPPHTPRGGAHWPKGMEQFTSFPLETSSCWLFDEQSVLKGCSLFLSVNNSAFSQGYSILRRLRNISFRDGSATFHFEAAPQHFIVYWLYGIRTNGCNYTDTLIRAVFEQPNIHSNIFQLI